MTAALEGGEWSAARPGRTLPPGKTRYPFYRRLGGPQSRSERAENLVPTGIRSRTFQPVVSPYTNLATGPTEITKGIMKFQIYSARLTFVQFKTNESHRHYHHHHHHHHHISVMKLGHLLTRSGLTYPEVSSKVYHDSFCQLDSTVSLRWVIYFEAFYLHVVSSFSCIPVICPKLVLFLSTLQSVHLFCNLSQVHPAVLLMYFISAAVILLASLALIIQVYIYIYLEHKIVTFFHVTSSDPSPRR